MNPSPWRVAGSLCCFPSILASGEDLPHPTAGDRLRHACRRSMRLSIRTTTRSRSLMTIPGVRLSRSIGRRRWESAVCRMNQKDRRFFRSRAPRSSGAPGKLITSCFNQTDWQPTEWSSFDGLTPWRQLPFEGSGHTMVLGSFSGFRDFNQPGNGRFGGPLVAQNHTYVRFEVRLNQSGIRLYPRSATLSASRGCRAPAAPDFDSQITASR